MMLQIIRRKRFFKLPLQANYYPLPTMAFIQDKIFRFTIVTGQPLGIASLKEGQIEVSHRYKIPFGQSKKNSLLFIERSEITFVPIIFIILLNLSLVYCFLFYSDSS
jgi:hypothetical protein